MTSVTHNMKQLSIKEVQTNFEEVLGDMLKRPSQAAVSVEGIDEAIRTLELEL